MTTKLALLSLLALVVVGAACDVDTAPDALRATPPGTGPLVRFDVNHRPLPEVPLPNDVATFADPTSRTGRRVNVSVVAPTHFEQNARDSFNSMEGWGTSSPITVAFDRSAATDPRDAAIDLEDVASRMQGDEHDLSNDPIYVVNLTTGIPAFVDVGNGYFPVTVSQPWRYFPNDPRAGASNLFFETDEEGAGLPQSAYRPDLDRDFDGVLDHPNTLGDKGIAGLDNLLTWYERETDTLILRPIIPLEEKTEYAVVLTDRLRGPDRQPVRSPFEAVYHPTQRSGVSRLEDILKNKQLQNYYGDVAGTGLDHVAFAWTFTTQPIHEDMQLLRDGLYGKGPFARFAAQYPAVMQIAQVAGPQPADQDQPDGWQTSNPACIARAKTPYIIKPNDPDINDTFKQIFTQVFGLDPGDIKATFTAFENIDHIVVGKFQSPYLMGDPKSIDPDARFLVDFQTGDGPVQPDDVSFFISVPKTTDAHKPPFPVSFWGHGATGHSDEILFYAGDYAKQGIALFGYNEPGHGLVFDPTDKALAQIELQSNCLVPFIGAVENGRAQDINGDGIPDSGALWWTAHIFHTRDNVRQGILDGMNAIRILRTFDGHIGTQDFNADGKLDPAGDFDGDGVVDVGGPNVPYFAAGESLGGIMSEIQGGMEPYMVAATPMSGGGALGLDVAFRSFGITEAVMSQVLGPAILAMPAGERQDPKDATMMGSVCPTDQWSVRIIVNDGDDNHEVEIACLTKAELAANKTVVVTNVRSGEVRCARTQVDGRFSIPIPTSIGDKLDIQIYDAPDVVTSYGTCKVMDGAPVGRRISTWEQKALFYTPVANVDDPSTLCTEPSGCAQFRAVFYAIGDNLVAPNEGLGLRRQSPELRRFGALAQAAYDPADPINYAPYYMLKQLHDENGNVVPPHGLLSINTVGDTFVNVAAGFNFARAAGAVPFLPPSALTRYPEYADYVTPDALYDQLGRKTPMQYFIDHAVVEGTSRIGRTSAGPACSPNYKPDATTCTDKRTIDPISCARALFDADWTSEGGLPYDQPHADVPVRLGRVAKIHVSDATSLAAAWEPRLRGVPFGSDGAAWGASDRVVAQLNHYLVPEGRHTWDVGDACAKWDYSTYGNRLMARFLSTQGQDVYYLSHPQTHECLADGTCDFLK